MRNITPADRRQYMYTIREYMFKDIWTAIDGEANYLAALGLSTYTENLGGLYCGNLRHSLGTHYISFIKKYFPKCYADLDNQLSTSGKGILYEIVRCGLVHEYFMKAAANVTIGTTGTVSCGIIYDPSKFPALIFVVDVYFEDFKKAFDNYYVDLLGTNMKMPDPQMESNFDSAVNGMKVSPFSPSSGLTGQSGSGISLP